jgi:hypothetical protein
VRDRERDRVRERERERETERERERDREIERGEYAHGDSLARAFDSMHESTMYNDSDGKRGKGMNSKEKQGRNQGTMR